MALEYDLSDDLFSITPTLISGGSSGGPVLNERGELLGMTMAVKSQYAVCISNNLIKKALSAWNVPTNLMTGVKLPGEDPLKGEMVLIRRGSYMMGSSNRETDQRPVHRVNISNFYMSRKEITVAQFEKFMQSTNYTSSAEKKGWSYIVNTQGKKAKKNGVIWKHDATGRNRPDSEYNHPVLHVSWDDAKAYCAWLSQESGMQYRLPTEAEWEYAAGNGSKHNSYSWGNSPVSPINKVTNGAGLEVRRKFPSGFNIHSRYNDGYSLTSPVGNYGSNDFGLFDMIGNVWEWCEDWYHESYKGAPNNGAAFVYPQGIRRSFRGGTWVLNPNSVKVTTRAHGTPSHTNYDVGIRVVREP